MRTEAPPREGLPPCIRGRVEYDGRAVVFSDGQLCRHTYGGGRRYAVSAGSTLERFKPEEIAHRTPHAYEMPHYRGEGFLGLTTDDEAEALAAYERACEWVRTGELPE